MISPIMKRENERRIAASQFKEGSFVAIVNTYADRHIIGKRAVAKVFKTGNFTIKDHDGKPNDQQWRPDFTGTYARKAGKRVGFRTVEHLEIWSPAIEQEIVDRKALHHARARRDAIIAALKKLDGDALRFAPLGTIEDALDIAGPNTED